MFYMKTIYILILCVLFVSCKKETETTIYKNLIIKDNITFATGFSSMVKFRGVIKENNQELIYFADPVSAKTIKFFTLNGVLTDSISLKELSVLGINADQLIIKSKDSIIAIGFNEMYLLNRKGNILKTIYLKRISNEGDKYTFMYPKINSFNNNLNEILFFCDWRKNLYKDYNHYYEGAFYKPKVLKITNPLDTVKSVYQYGDIFYKNISDLPKVYFENPTLSIYKDRFYMMSSYSNVLFVYDLATMKKIRETKIASNFTPIGVVPFTISNNKPYYTSNEYHKLHLKYGFNRYIFLNNKNIYLLNYLKYNNGDIDIMKRPFSILKLNHNLETVGELAFQDLVYRGGSFLVTEKGILLENNNLSDYEKNTYTLFNF